MAAPITSSDLVVINGPLLLGTLFGYGLLGILVVQVLIYYRQFPNDRVWTKLLVGTVFIADIVLTIFPTMIIWHRLVSGWGDLATIGLLDWPFTVIAAMSGYVTTVIRIFFCWRIWKLCRSYILPCIVVVVSFVAWGAELFCGRQGVVIGISKIHELEPFVILWLVGTVICDFSITATLITVLVTRGSKTGFKKLSGVIRRLIQMTVETTLITTVGAVANLVLFTVFRRANMHFLVYFIIAKIHTNTLLTSLNARTYINSANTTVKTVSFPLWEDQLKMTTESRYGGTHGTTFSKRLENRHIRCGDSASDV